MKNPTLEQRYQCLVEDLGKIRDIAYGPYPSSMLEAIRRLTEISYLAENAYNFATADPEDITIKGAG